MDFQLLRMINEGEERTCEQECRYVNLRVEKQKSTVKSPIERHDGLIFNLKIFEMSILFFKRALSENLWYLKIYPNNRKLKNQRIPHTI